MKKELAALALLACFSAGWAGPTQATFVNGNFSDGLNAWSTENMDGFGSFTTPGSVSVNAAGQAVLATQGVGSNIIQISLFQWLEIPDWAHTLSFDVWFETGVHPDGSAEPWSFPDFFLVSYLDDVLDVDLDADGIPDASSYDQMLLGYDVMGPYDPNSLAPISLGAGFHFSADISSLAGRTGTPYFDLVDNPDGWFTTVTLDNVEIHPVPEPATLVLLGTGLVGLLAARKKQPAKPT